MKLAVSADGDDAAASYELARVRLAAGDTDGAIAAYVKCMTFGIRSPAIFNNLGTALLKAARYDEAIDALKTALLLQPGYTRALVNLGKAFRDTGRLAEAVVSLREALTATPDYIPALINLADAFASARDRNSARQALERAIQLAPRQPEPLMALGVV